MHKNLTEQRPKFKADLFLEPLHGVSFGKPGQANCSIAPLLSREVVSGAKVGISRNEVMGEDKMGIKLYLSNSREMLKAFTASQIRASSGYFWRSFYFQVETLSVLAKEWGKGLTREMWPKNLRWSFKYERAASWSSGTRTSTMLRTT